MAPAAQATPQACYYYVLEQHPGANEEVAERACRPGPAGPGPPPRAQWVGVPPITWFTRRRSPLQRRSCRKARTFALARALGRRR